LLEELSKKDMVNYYYPELIRRIKELLEQPEREPLSVGCIQNGLSSEEVPDYKAMTFIKGIKFAEKMHNIGEIDE